MPQCESGTKKFCAAATNNDKNIQIITLLRFSLSFVAVSSKRAFDFCTTYELSPKRFGRRAAHHLGACNI